MRLTEKALKRIKSDNEIKARLSLAFNKSGFTIERWISENEDNGDLTKAIAIKVIEDNTELSKDEILESLQTKAA